MIRVQHASDATVPDASLVGLLLNGLQGCSFLPSLSRS